MAPEKENPCRALVYRYSNPTDQGFVTGIAQPRATCNCPGSVPRRERKAGYGRVYIEVCAEDGERERREFSTDKAQQTREREEKRDGEDGGRRRGLQGSCRKTREGKARRFKDPKAGGVNDEGMDGVRNRVEPVCAHCATTDHGYFRVFRYKSWL